MTIPLPWPKPNSGPSCVHHIYCQGTVKYLCSKSYDSNSNAFRDPIIRNICTESPNTIGKYVMEDEDFLFYICPPLT